jgi:hypothetical protein
MAIVNPNSELHALTGRVSSLVIRHVGAKTIASCRPNPTDRPPTVAQITHRVRFRNAMDTAKRLVGAAESRARYEAIFRAQGGASVFMLAFQDAMRKPEIRLIALDTALGPQGDVIRIEVADITVASVEVTVRSPDGQKLEKGLATQDGQFWRYQLSQPVPVGESRSVEVTARDVPGNASTLVAVVSRALRKE